MKPVITSTNSDTTVISDVGSAIDVETTFMPGSQRRVRLLPNQQEIINTLKRLGVQPRQGARFSSSESSASPSGSDEERHISEAQETMSGKDITLHEAVSIQTTLSELAILSINSPTIHTTRLWHSDSEAITTKRVMPESDITFSSTVKPWSSCHDFFSSHLFQEKPAVTNNITTSEEIPSSNLEFTVPAQGLEDIPDTSFFGESLLTHTVSPEALTVTPQPEGSQIQPSPPDFPPGSGARPKTTSAEPKKKKKKKKKKLKQTEKTAPPGSAKKAVIPLPIQPASSSVQDVPERSVATPRQSDIQPSIPIKGLTQQMMQADSNELQAFNKEIKQLYRQISNQNWSQIKKIQANLDRFLPELERLSQDYELFTRSYPASSSDKRPFGKTESCGITLSILFTYKQRSDAASMLAVIAHYMIDHMEQFLLQYPKNKRFLDHLLGPILKTVCLWLKWIIEIRINDQQAIDDRHGAGIPVDETMASINLRQQFSLQATINEPRCSEAIMNQVFYRVISWLASGDIFYQKLKAAGQQVKLEYLYTSQQLLTQLLRQYRDHRPFKNYEPQPDTENFFEIHLNYAEQLIFCVHAQRWDLAQITLQRLSSMIATTESPTSPPQVAPPTSIQAQREEEQKKTEWEKLVDEVQQSIDPQKWHQECVNRHFYPPHEYLSMSLNAGHRCFSYFYQQHISSSAPQEYNLNIEQLRLLLTRFKQWAERMIAYGLVTTPGQVVDPLFQEGQNQLEENTQQLEQLHQNNLRFLAQYFQEHVAPPPKKTKDRKKRETMPTGRAGSLSEEDTPDASSKTAALPIVQPDSEAAELTTVVELSEREEAYSDGEAEWQQVQPRRRRMRVETALNKLSEALGCQNTESAVAVLRSTDLHDASQQLQNPSPELEALPVAVLIPLVSGYIQVRDMSRHISHGESLIPNIRPFIISLLDEDALTSINITNQFTGAIEEFNSADVEAQQALDNISDTINTLLELQTESESSENTAVITACDILITATQKLKKRLVNLREGIINAWKKRYELLLRHYPEKLKSKKEKTKSTDKPLKTLFTNNTAFKKCSSDFEKCQNTHQEKQKSRLQAEQSGDSSGPPHSQVPVQQDISKILKRSNLSLDQVPSITVLSHRIDFIAKKTRNMPKDEVVYRLTLAFIALHLDIEISVLFIDSNTPNEMPRDPSRVQPEQRPPLVNYFTHPLSPYTESERIRALRDYFHQKTPAILAELNATETGMPVVLTGSMAFQLQILSLWDNVADATLSRLYEQAAQSLPAGITHNHMQACMIPRDTDLIVLNHSQFTVIVERLKTSLDHARMEHQDLRRANGSVVTSGPEQRTAHNKTITTDRLIVMGTESYPENIHYSIDVTMGTYPDQPSPDHYTTLSHGNSNIHLRRMDDIVLDELDIIQIKYVGEERIQKAITRLFMIAFLECQQPTLDSVSRIALLHALDSLPGEDPIIKALAEQLRQRPFYIICHEGRFQGARKTEPDRPFPS